MTRYGEYESKDEISTRDLYRRVFTTTEGTKVLSLILADLGAFEAPEPGNREQEALRSYATLLLERLGAFHEHNLEQITRALLGVKVYFPEENESGDE